MYIMLTRVDSNFFPFFNPILYFQGFFFFQVIMVFYFYKTFVYLLSLPIFVIV